MCRIEFAEHCAVQPLIGPHVTEFRAAEHGSFPLGYLDPLHAAANAHRVVPRPRHGGQPSNHAAPSEWYFLVPRGKPCLFALRRGFTDETRPLAEEKDSKLPVPPRP